PTDTAAPGACRHVGGPRSLPRDPIRRAGNYGMKTRKVHWRTMKAGNPAVVLLLLLLGAWSSSVRAGAPDRDTGGADHPFYFLTDVGPELTKLGCNSGGCHGKSTGQNGFKLSLLGFEPGGDYDALVTEARGRRINASSPQQSLMLVKATAAVPHGGGKR